MAVDKKVVLHTSVLARLDLAQGTDGAEAEERIETFARQMEQIVGYMDILAEADTEGVEPMFSPMSLTAAPVEDEVLSVCEQEDVLAGAPAREGGFFIVPRVL